MLHSFVSIDLNTENTSHATIACVIVSNVKVIKLEPEPSSVARRYHLFSTISSTHVETIVCVKGQIREKQTKKIYENISHNSSLLLFFLFFYFF